MRHTAEAIGRGAWGRGEGAFDHCGHARLPEICRAEPVDVPGTPALAGVVLRRSSALCEPRNRRGAPIETCALAGARLIRAHTGADCCIMITKGAV